jgi:hypothetical protein
MFKKQQEHFMCYLIPLLSALFLQHKATVIFFSLHIHLNFIVVL